MKRTKVSLNKKNNLTPEEKIERINENLTEFTEDDYLFTINYVFTEFLVRQSERGNSLATIDFYKRFYKKFCKFLNEIGCEPKETPIKMITKLGATQMTFMKYLKSFGVNEQTVNSYLRGYRAFGNYAEEEGYIQGFKCPIKKVEAPIKQVYTDNEISKLLVKPKKEFYTEYRNYTIINLILSTGARSNTILNIKMSDIDLEERTITFNTTKAHKTTIIPLNSDITRILKEYISLWKHASAKGYLFFNEYGEQLTRSGLCKAIATYNKNRGVEKTSIHLFRHTFAKHWIQSGKDIFSLKKILTHSELAMVERYSNIYSNDLEKAVNQDSILAQHRIKSGMTVSKRKKIQLLDSKSNPLAG